LRRVSHERVVLDASAAVAMLLDVGPEGEWATALVTGALLAAPDLMPFEAGNILRRQAMAGIVDPSAATLAHRDLTSLRLELCPYSALAERAWALRENLTIYDATYVALAELLAVPLVTLDRRIAGASGPRCAILAYEPD
jgi:predicted nucleic acid-binding protein